MRATIRGIELFYLTHGRGVPILTMHGGPGLDHTSFRPWLDNLADSATLIYHDYRGNGRSGGRTELAGVDLDMWVDDAEALRQHLQHEKIFVLGHAFGGFLAQMYAAKYPQHTAGLILCDTVPALDYPQVMMSNAQAHCTPAQLGQVIQMMSRPVPDDATLRRMWNAVLPSYFHRFDPKIGAAMDEVMSYCAAAYNHGLFTLAEQLNTLPLLPNIAAPTLVLAGRHDWLMPPAQGAERLAQGIPRSELALFDESGHFPFVEEPIAFCKVVRSWLRKVNI